MYRLTERRKQKALAVLDEYTRQLHDRRFIQAGLLERELRSLWGIGYQELKDVMIDMMSNHDEYTHLAAYYMEHSNAPGVVTEFQPSLAKLYGIRWYGDNTREAKRAAYWDGAFASISRFDLETPH